MRRDIKSTYESAVQPGGNNENTGMVRCGRKRRRNTVLVQGLAEQRFHPQNYLLNLPPNA